MIDTAPVDGIRSLGITSNKNKTGAPRQSSHIAAAGDCLLAPKNLPNKKASQHYSALGLLGNGPRYWSSIEDLEKENPPCMIYVRSPRIDWRYMRSNLPVRKVRAYRSRIMKIGGWHDGITFVEAPLLHWEKINFEGMRHSTGLVLRYALGRPDLTLREDLGQNGIEVEGLQAELILRRHVPPEDLDMLEELWENHPDSVGEFTVMDRPMGIFHRRTVCWEWRNY